MKKRINKFQILLNKNLFHTTTNNRIISGIYTSNCSRLQQAGGATVLPNREIPTNNNAHLTRMNKLTKFYTNENENYEEERSMEDLIKQSQNKKVEQDRLDIMYEELQTPLMVMILFFFFQLPIFQKTMTKYAPSLFLRDGNPTFSGYFVKTLGFGVTYYIITKVIKQLSEI